MERVMEHVLRNMRRKHVRGNMCWKQVEERPFRTAMSPGNSQAFRPCGLGGRQAIAKKRVSRRPPRGHKLHLTPTKTQCMRAQARTKKVAHRGAPREG